MYKRAILLTLTLTIMTACTGCTIGIKETRSIVMVSPRPIPEAAKGTPVIATNDRLPLVILDKPDMHFRQNVGGYVLVDPWFYELLIKTYNERKAAE